MVQKSRDNKQTYHMRECITNGFDSRPNPFAKSLSTAACHGTENIFSGITPVEEEIPQQMLWQSTFLEGEVAEMPKVHTNLRGDTKQ
jgi:hypothetical protein